MSNVITRGYGPKRTDGTGPSTWTAGVRLYAKFTVSRSTSLDLKAGFFAATHHRDLYAVFSINQGIENLHAFFDIFNPLDWELRADELTIPGLNTAMSVMDNDRELVVTPSRRLGRARARDFDVK
jgi:hypothetical protein